MYGALDISVSGMVAQRTRLEVISSNLANASTPLDPSSGEPGFQRRIALFSPGAEDGVNDQLGVRVSQIAFDDAPPRPVWDPGHPLAVKESDPRRGLEEGYVYYPNIDPVVEQTNAVVAMRAYEANVAAAEATKTMLAEAMRLLA
jgi:flagellar basal-body rod protein FlgC